MLAIGDGILKVSHTSIKTYPSGIGGEQEWLVVVRITGVVFHDGWSQGFQGYSNDGLGDDWPIGYDDVKPYYDKIDKLLGIFGSVENIENERMEFLPPPQPRLHELW